MYRDGQTRTRQVKLLRKVPARQTLIRRCFRERRTIRKDWIESYRDEEFVERSFQDIEDKPAVDRRDRRASITPLPPM